MNAIVTILMILAIIYFLIIPTLKTGVFSVKKLIITPAIFAYLNYESVQRHFHIHFVDYFILLSGLIVGILLGAFFRRTASVRADREKGLIEVTGSYYSLMVFIAIFCVHFVIGYLQSVNPSYLLQTSLGGQILLFLLTLTSSMPMGSNGLLFYKYRLIGSVKLTNT